MPAILRPPTWELVGQAASYEAIPKWQLAEALAQAFMHKHKEIRNHAQRRETAFREIHEWIALAGKLEPERPSERAMRLSAALHRREKMGVVK